MDGVSASTSNQLNTRDRVASPLFPVYTYRAEVLTVYDGDTITVRVDLGLGASLVERIRLFRINAPEIRGESKVRGLASKEALIKLLQEECQDMSVIISTVKDKKGKYGRYLADVYTGKGTCVNDYLVENGLAEYKEY